MTESETFRKLKQTPYNELKADHDLNFHGNDLVNYLESHSWTLREYLEKVCETAYPPMNDNAVLIDQLYDFYTKQHDRIRNFPQT